MGRQAGYYELVLDHMIPCLPSALHAPSQNGCVVNDQTIKASSKRVSSPMGLRI